MIRVATICLALSAGPAVAFTLTLPPSAERTVERNTAPDVFLAPIGVFADGTVPMTTIEGAVDRSAWRIPTQGLTPFQVMRPLRQQLVDAGYQVVLDCASEACGGFDFRFAVETLPGPNMYVNIRAFHVVTGLKGSDEAVFLLASTAATSAYVQIMHARADTGQGPLVPLQQAPAAEPVVVETSLVQQLSAQGHAVLSDLVFDTGSTALGPGPFASLAALAEYMLAVPDMRIALVGHTDTVGGLAPNIEISRARARSVRARMSTVYDIPAARMDAEGMGYLAPQSTNLTAEGREENRRVEVVLLGVLER